MTNSRTGFAALGLPTLIGSLPLASHAEALDLIFAHTPAVPLWPQLPSLPQERMLNQFVAGLPGIVEETDRTFFNTEGDRFQEELVNFFEEYLAAAADPAALDASRFAVSRDRAAGLYAFADKVATHPEVRAVKGQITGPFTLLSGLHDQHRRLAYYDANLREAGVKGLALKAGWQARFLAKTGKPALLFIDEPALAGLGSSSFISIALDDIRQDLTEVIDAVHAAGVLAGVHVCANTEWDFLLSLPLDVVSFDAHGFFDRFITCRAAITSFLARGGIIAWGGVPTSEVEHIEKETAASLVALWENHADQVGFPGGREGLLAQTLITPSCGTGSLSLPHARKVLELTRDVSATLRKRYGKDA